MNIRIHHFFDIIRDYGIAKEFTPHPYMHAYHIVAEIIRDNPDLELELIKGSDMVCKGCIHLINNSCDDIITHRADFTGKEEFNNHLDNRIIDVCQVELSKKYSPKKLCEIAHKYLESIDFIYEGNDLGHTLARKENVLKGLIYYSERHHFIS